MRIKSAINLYQLQQLVEQHYARFSDFEQKFLVNMLASAETNSEISDRQWAFLSRLITQMQVYSRLHQRLHTRA